MFLLYTEQMFCVNKYSNLCLYNHVKHAILNLRNSVFVEITSRQSEEDEIENEIHIK